MAQGFRDRVEAGKALGDRLAEMSLDRPVVLGLARGGVPVAAQVARRLNAPLDVFVARKIGAPGQPELGVGAVAEGGEPVFDAVLLRRLGLRPADLAATVAAEQAEIARRVAAYRPGRRREPVTERTAVLVDDGLATGGTARAGLAALRTRNPARLVLAVPVAPPETVARLAAHADDVVALLMPRRFTAVGAWYRHFGQLSDDEVLAIVRAAAARRRDHAQPQRQPDA
ncbi:MAG: phosphoribosyltransferase [Actinomycetes bacterium]